MKRRDMNHLALLSCVVPALVSAACIPSSLQPVKVEPSSRAIVYIKDVKPILDSRCVVCHSCYNAPCQLKLGSHEGVDRGGSKTPVYLASRLRTHEPTRLFVDARSSAEWRTKGFHSVTESSASGSYNDSLMLYLLQQKQTHPQMSGSYDAEASDLVCAANPTELGSHLRAHPDHGMPFGLPALSGGEHKVLATWIQRGANGPSVAEHAALRTPSAAAASEIEKWEGFLNQADAKHAMTARYLYEHFFLAHLVFSEADPSQFYRLVRSRTPPGEPVSEIATVRPYDDPEASLFWYRFERIHSTIVHKTHMVVEFTDAVYARYQDLFIETDWLETPHLVAFDEERSANPFVVYAQIPPVVRYRFLLSHSEYMLRTFIRGPVCKGQVALNVIHDHFWAFFLDPNADLTVRDPSFLVSQADNLRLPNEEGSSAPLVKSFSNDYRERYARFYRAKNELYGSAHAEGPSLQAIWPGDTPADSPALTVYRHFDSATVMKGVVGSLPRTLWVIDYPQLERIYYALVAGFDVFGNLSHQVNVRRYMDYLRMEGELNFISFLPREIRAETLKAWYLGDGAVEDVAPDEVLQEWGTQIAYETADPKRELAELIVRRRLLAETRIGFDDVNYRQANVDPPPMPTSFDSREDVMNGFRALTAPGTAFIAYHNDSDSNLIYVRLRGTNGQDHFVSIVINRWHDNVNSMFGEQKALDSSKDTMDFIEGSVGSYPNFFLDVDAANIADFFDMMASFDGSPDYLEKLRKYGVNRSDSDFWQTYEWFQAELERRDPIRAGLYDLNRYHHSAGGS